MRIKVRNLVKDFGRTRAVDRINFSFDSGEVYGFVGPNGAGKTTTMRIMATLDEPNGGDIFLDGVSLLDYPEEARRQLGFMPDTLPAHRDMTVEECLDFFARAYGLHGRQRRKRLEGVMEFTNLQGIRYKTLAALSKGMKQRVSLARAIVHDPSVLILDEPAAGLDPRARIELRELVKTLRQQGKAILISSHILTELAEICTGAVIIERGRLLRSGRIDQIVHGDTPRETQKQEIFIRALDVDTKTLSRRLLETPLVESVIPVEEPGEGVRTFLNNGPESACSLLKWLVHQEIPVVEFTPRRAGLEDLFMTITQGKVQ